MVSPFFMDFFMVGKVLEFLGFTAQESGVYHATNMSAGTGAAVTAPVAVSNGVEVFLPYIPLIAVVLTALRLVLDLVKWLESRKGV